MLQLTRRRALSTYRGGALPSAAKAQVAELVDALVSGTSAARRGGSSPLLGTTSSSPSFAAIHNALQICKILAACPSPPCAAICWYSAKLLVFLLVSEP